MNRILKAAAYYFAAVFGAGFVLGTVRVLWLAPQLGARAAELLETPIMLVVMLVAARSIEAPTLIVSVEDDLYGTYASAKYTAAHIRNARFVGYPSGGHLLAGHNDEVMAELKAFLGGSSAVGMAR